MNNEKVKVDYTGFNEITKSMDEVYVSENFSKNDNIQETETNPIK